MLKKKGGGGERERKVELERDEHIISQSLPLTAKSLQSCPTICDSIDGSPPGSAVPGTLQARTVAVGKIKIYYQNSP